MPVNITVWRYTIASEFPQSDYRPYRTYKLTLEADNIKDAAQLKREPAPGRLAEKRHRTGATAGVRNDSDESQLAIKSSAFCKRRNSLAFRGDIGFLTLLSFLCAGVVEADLIVTHPYRGITYITRTESSPRKVTLHVVEIDLTASGIRFKLTPPGGTRDTVRQTTLDFLKQEKAQVAINAHFFLPFPSPDTDANLVGLAVSQGITFQHSGIRSLEFT